MPTKTVTGNPITIYDAAAGQPVSLIANIEYTQSGSGTPSPTNKRPITGLSALNVKVQGRTGTPNNYNVDFTGVGGPIYKGSLNLTTGVLTVTHVGFTFTGSESNKKWYISGNKSRLIYPAAENDRIYLAMYPSNVVGDIVSNYLPAETEYNTYRWSMGVAMGINASQIFISAGIPFDTIQDGLDWIAAHGDLTCVAALATPVTYQLSPPQIALLSGYNNITSNAKTLTIEYNTKSFSVDVPQLFTYSPANPYAGDTVTLTYTGEIAIDTLVAVGVDTMTNIPLTKTGDKTWKFTMPTEDVGVTVGYKPYAEIELNQTTGGVVSANKLIAYDGDVVTLALTPAENYEPQSVKVTKDARDVDTTKVSDRTYTFVVHIQ